MNNNKLNSIKCISEGCTVIPDIEYDFKYLFADHKEADVELLKKYETVMLNLKVAKNPHLK